MQTATSPSSVPPSAPPSSITPTTTSTNTNSCTPTTPAALLERLDSTFSATLSSLQQHNEEVKNSFLERDVGVPTTTTNRVSAKVRQLLSQVVVVVLRDDEFVEKYIEMMLNEILAELRGGNAESNGMEELFNELNNVLQELTRKVRAKPPSLGCISTCWSQFAAMIVETVGQPKMEGRSGLILQMIQVLNWLTLIVVSQGSTADPSAVVTQLCDESLLFNRALTCDILNCTAACLQLPKNDMVLSKLIDMSICRPLVKALSLEKTRVLTPVTNIVIQLLNFDVKQMTGHHSLMLGDIKHWTQLIQQICQLTIANQQHQVSRGDKETTLFQINLWVTMVALLQQHRLFGNEFLAEEKILRSLLFILRNFGLDKSTDHLLITTIFNVVNLLLSQFLAVHSRHSANNSRQPLVNLISENMEWKDRYFIAEQYHDMYDLYFPFMMIMREVGQHQFKKTIPFEHQLGARGSGKPATLGFIDVVVITTG